MGRCGCASPETCGCFFTSSGDIFVTGAGSAGSPYNLGLPAGRLPVIVCTSGTRPANPAAGQVIFETDTKRLLVHVGGNTWDQIEYGRIDVTSALIGNVADVTIGKAVPYTKIFGGAGATHTSPAGGFDIPLDGGPFGRGLASVDLQCGTGAANTPLVVNLILANTGLGNINGAIFRTDGAAVTNADVLIWGSAIGWD